VVFEMPYKKGGVEKEKAIHQVLHGVKDHILAPFVAVEMLGLAFGFDFLGKTFLPEKYLKLKELAFKDHTRTSLMVNKLSEEEIEQITRSYYLTLIRSVLQEHLGMQDIDDKVVSRVYEACINGEDTLDENLKKAVEVLKNKYKVDRGLCGAFQRKTEKRRLYKGRAGVSNIHSPKKHWFNQRLCPNSFCAWTREQV
jgi:uncharacterized protein YbcC (UPF0753/DUF2309 family)